VEAFCSVILLSDKHNLIAKKYAKGKHLSFQ